MQPIESSKFPLEIPASRDTDKFTSLHIACRDGAPESLVALIIEVAARDEDGRNKTVATRRSQQDSRNKTVATRQSQQDSRNKTVATRRSPQDSRNIFAQYACLGKLPIHYAIASGNASLIKLLIHAHPAALDSVDNSTLPTHIATIIAQARSDHR